MTVRSPREPAGGKTQDGGQMTTPSPTRLPDLTSCDREPIHIPGSIQPYGALLGMDRDGLIDFAGSNARTVLGTDRSPLGLLGTDVMPVALYDTAMEFSGSPAGRRLELFGFEVGGKTFDILLHISPTGQLLLEFDPAPGRPQSTIAENAQDVIDLGRLSLSHGLLDAAVGLISRLTGFERVMAYRFDSDYNGQVVAEARRHDDVESFLGHHFPASDIPRQARDLYVQNPFRIIPDVSYTPVPIEGASSTASALDLSYSLLRSVSPVHIEYLQNMGVQASMSLSLLDGKRLWGLITCHNSEPLQVPAAARATSRLIADAVSRQIELEAALTTQRGLTRISSTLSNIQDRVIASLVRTDMDVASVAAAVCGESSSLLNGFESDGIIVSIGDVTCVVGQTPSGTDLEDLLSWFREDWVHDFLHTDRLGAVSPWAHGIDGTYGLLGIKLEAVEDAVVLLCRGLRMQREIWAGNPQKPVDLTDEASMRLTPRKSFESWEVQVSDRSTPWSKGKVAAARQLQSSLNRILHTAEEISSERSRLTQVEHEKADYQRLSGRLQDSIAEVEQAKRRLEVSNLELQQFAYVASHDLQTPLRSIAGFAQILRDSYGPSLDAEGQEYLDRIARGAQTMGQLIQGLLKYSRVESSAMPLTNTDLRAPAEEAWHRLEDAALTVGATIEIDEMPTVAVDQVQMSQCFQNLLENALKYRGAEPPRILISSQVVGSDWVITVADNGIGIAEPHLQEIFEIFRRLHTAEEYPGTGIGLGVCRRIIERHGGRIWVESQPGEGSAFKFALPRTRTRQQATHQETGQS